MSPAQAILAGAALIAVSVIVSLGVHPATAAVSGGPYQLMHHSNTAANAGVFRLDVTSGEVSYCYLMGGTNPAQPELVCSRPAK